MALEPTEIFADLESVRASGALEQQICAGRVTYSASERHPGRILRSLPDGTVEVGLWLDGRFEPDSNLTE